MSIDIKEPFAIHRIWDQLYGSRGRDALQAFLNELDAFKDTLTLTVLPDQWYKDVVVYSLYVDLFNKDFRGLEDKLPYLQDLGVSCLWLLPILESPMRDAGFDVSDYRKIRSELLPAGEGIAAFSAFLARAHALGIRVIFDVALNHTSDKHPWFAESRKNPDGPYRDFYLWRDHPNSYLDARIIFQGLEESNWQKDGEAWYFHRFFHFQPDLNYRNPHVLIEMSRVLVYWLGVGVDGFRADAIPYLWKEDGTGCENLAQTHIILKFFRQVLDYIRPNTLLLAEACQKPREVVKYFGEGDECHAGYHFPLMPQIFKAIALQEAAPVIHVLSKAITPDIPVDSQWFTFLRCHDELSLERVYVTEEDRRFIHETYCKQEKWDFREGQGISARLAELMDHDPRKIGLAFSIMLSLPGTPVIYYGDEFGKANDEAFYQQQSSQLGLADSRFLVRGKIDWQALEKDLVRRDSLAARTFFKLKSLIKVRTKHPAFGRGDIQWHQALDSEGRQLPQLMVFSRFYQEDFLLCVHNLSEKLCHWNYPKQVKPELERHFSAQEDMACLQDEVMIIQPYAYHWIALSSRIGMPAFLHPAGGVF